MNNKKLFNRNFIIVITGQIISIFGNAVLRFALPLYILDQTGSTTIFGSILAVAAIPTIIFSPFGGILADRFNRKNLMVILDLITAVVIVGFSLLLEDVPVVILIGLMLVVFSIIQSFYQPAVQASIPVISSKDNLEKANGIVSLVNAVSFLLGPLFAGVLYGLFGIWPILIICMCCFLMAAVMEMFIIMKFERQKEYDSIVGMVKSDFKVSINYMFKDNPIVIKAMLIASGMNLFLTSSIMVGLPAMITVRLGLSSQFYGLAQGAMAAGMITGGILISIVGKRVQVQQVYKMLVYSSLGLIPIAFVFTINLQSMVIYWTIFISCFSMNVAITMFTITMMSFVQRVTPDELIGKVISYILVITQCTLPVGQAVYGFLFEVMADSINILVFVTALCTIGIAIYSKKVFSEFSNKRAELRYVKLNT